MSEAPSAPPALVGLRKARLAREVLRAPTEEEALRRIGDELDWPLLELTTPEERGQIHGWVLAVLRRERPEQLRVRREDLLGGVAVALIILLATFPVVVPYLVVSDPNVAVRISNLIALAELFVLGAQWGRTVGGRPLRIAGALTLLGMLLVLVTIALGG
jgi:VIT1/CCC1 family predicted Fe2+/Mn2+ transporter